MSKKIQLSPRVSIWIPRTKLGWFSVVLFCLSGYQLFIGLAWTQYMILAMLFEILDNQRVEK